MVFKPVLQEPLPCTFCMSSLSDTPDSSHQLVSRDCKAWIGCVWQGRHKKCAGQVWKPLGMLVAGLLHGKQVCNKVYFASWDQLGILVCWWTSISWLLGAGMIPARQQQNVCMCYISCFFWNWFVFVDQDNFPNNLNELYNKEKHVACLHSKIPSVKQTLLSFHMILIYRE